MHHNVKEETTPTESTATVSPRAGIATLGDAALLTDFCRSGNEVAFRAILDRYAPMVSSVCMAVLGNRADAEDAFQAAFFVLARKAARISNKERLGAWLHRVALRCALATLRAKRNQMTAEMPEDEEIASAALEKISSRAMIQSLHEQLDMLPEKYRVPLIAHYLRGEEHRAAARQLGISEVALRKRLERGRSALRRRLGVLGLAGLSISSVCNAAVAAGSRSVSNAVLNSTVSVATQVRAVWAKGLMAATGHQTSLALAEGVIRTMFITTLAKTSTAVFLGAFAGLIAMAAVAVAEESDRQSGQDRARDAQVLMAANEDQAENADGPPRPEIATQSGDKDESNSKADPLDNQQKGSDPVVRGNIQGHAVDRVTGTLVQGQTVDPLSGTTLLGPTIDATVRGNIQGQVIDRSTGTLFRGRAVDPLSGTTLLGPAIDGTVRGNIQGQVIDRSTGTLFRGRAVDPLSGTILLGSGLDREFRSNTVVKRTPIQHRIEQLEAQLELCRQIEQLESDNAELRRQVQQLQRALREKN